jgi:cell division septation protein DedD
MSGHLPRIFPLSVLLLLLISILGCENPKPNPPPSPFDEQQAIVSYNEVKKGEYTVQIGETHKSVNGAVSTSARLRASSIANFIETTESRDVYRVCVGKFRTKGRAEAVKEALLRKNLRCGQIKIAGPLK